MRLTRFGSKKNPIYRIVVSDSAAPRDGRAIEYIGRYNPQLEPSLIEIDAERARLWLSRGAQPSAPVRRLLQKAGVV
jgi:small subunit ribosomal protein S16